MREAVVSDRHLRDDGKVGDAPHRAQRLVQLVHVAERLEDEAVHAAGEQPRGLALEQGARLLARGGPERLDADPQRADRAHDAGASGCRRARQLGGRLVDPFRLFREAVARELRGVRA